jgi:hypothetical protein
MIAVDSPLTVPGYHGDPKHPMCSKFYYVVDADEHSKPYENARWSREQHMWIVQSDNPCENLSPIDHYIVSYFMKVGW